MENLSKNLPFEAVQTQGGSLAISSERGPVALLDLEVNGDLQFTDESEDYRDWIGNYFSSDELNDPTTGEKADADGDGRNNLLEYALGLHPRESQDSGEGIRMKIVEDTDGNRYLAVTFRRRLNDPRLEYLPEVSGDGGQTWQSGSAFLLKTAVVPLEGVPFEEVTYQETTPGVAGHPRIFRLTVRNSM